MRLIPGALLIEWTLVKRTLTLGIEHKKGYLRSFQASRPEAESQGHNHLEAGSPEDMGAAT